MKKLFTLLAGAALAMALTTAAEAIPTLTLSDGITTHVLNPSVDGNFYDTIGNFTFNGAGQSDQNALDLYFGLSTSRFGGGTLTIKYSDTGFNVQSAGVAYNLTAIPQGSVNFSGYYAPLLGTAALIGSGSGAAGSNINYSNETPQMLPDGTYTFSEVIEITQGANKFSMLNSSIAPVPEPGTMVLLGSGFLILAIYYKRKKNA